MEPSKGSKKKFTKIELKHQMNCLHANGYDKYYHHRPTDHRGHLVASRFGGLAEIYNMVPQHPLLNSNNKMFQNYDKIDPNDYKMDADYDKMIEYDGWYQQEDKIARFIAAQLKKNRNSCPGAKFRVAVNYHFHDNIYSDYFRPLGFKMEIDFYENIDTLDTGTIGPRNGVRKYYSNEISCEIENKYSGYPWPDTEE